MLRIARENPNFGYGKIAGEMRKLGYTGFGRSSVKRILDRHGCLPRPPHTGLSWHDFKWQERQLRKEMPQR